MNNDSCIGEMLVQFIPYLSNRRRVCVCCVCMLCGVCVCVCSQVKRKVLLHIPGMSSMLEMPRSQISTSRRFLSRLSSTIFFKDLDILAGNGKKWIGSAG